MGDPPPPRLREDRPCSGGYADKHEGTHDVEITAFKIDQNVMVAVQTAGMRVDGVDFNDSNTVRRR